MSAPAATAQLTPDQLLSLTPAQQNAYFAQQPDGGAGAKAQLAQYKMAINSANTQYLQQSIDRYAVCPPTGGGSTAAYVAGTTLNFNFPTAGGAFIRELEFVLSITFTPATGTGATYGYTPAGAYAFLTEIDIIYNGQQARIRPYFLKILDTIRKRQWLPFSQVLTGLNGIAAVTTNVASAQPALTGGTPATSKFIFRLPLQLQRWSPVGMLPAQGQGTKGQINVQCATTLGAANPDPMLVPINFTGGTGNSIGSVTGTLQINAIYNDGTNYLSKTPLSLNLANVPTAQYIIEQQLNPLTAATINRQRIATLLNHYIAVSVIIDGVQSTSFATVGNIQQIELDQDSAGQNKFWLYGAPNNTTYYDYAERMRQYFGQDLDAGVIVWVDALQFNGIDVDDQNGNQPLNMTSGAWTDVNYGVQVGAVTTTNFTPRVETYLFSRNDAGLVLA